MPRIGDVLFTFGAKIDSLEQALQRINTLLQTISTTSARTGTALAQLAQVQNQIAASAQQAAQAQQQAANAATQAAKAHQEAAQSIRSGVGALQDIQGAAQAATAAFTALTTGLLSVGFGRFINEAAQIAGKVDVFASGLRIAATNAGLVSTAVADQVQKIKALGITSSEANEQLRSLIQAQIDIKKSSELARVAQDLAAGSLMNSSQAFQTLSVSIASQEVLLLRNFGIVTTLEEIYSKYARQIGSAASALDDNQKRQAFLNKVLDEGAKVAGTYTASLENAQKQLLSFARFQEEATRVVGEQFQPVMLTIIKTLNEALDAFTRAGTGIHQFSAVLITAITGFVAAISALSALGAALSLVKLGLAGLAAIGLTGGIAVAIAVGVGVLAGAIALFSARQREAQEETKKFVEETSRSATESRVLVDRLIDLRSQSKQTTQSLAEQDQILAKLAVTYPLIAEKAKDATVGVRELQAATSAATLRETERQIQKIEQELADVTSRLKVAQGTANAIYGPRPPNAPRPGHFGALQDEDATNAVEEVARLRTEVEKLTEARTRLIGDNRAATQSLVADLKDINEPLQVLIKSVTGTVPEADRFFTILGRAKDVVAGVREAGESGDQVLVRLKKTLSDTELELRKLTDYADFGVVDPVAIGQAVDKVARLKGEIDSVTKAIEALKRGESGRSFVETFITRKQFEEASKAYTDLIASTLEFNFKLEAAARVRESAQAETLEREANLRREGYRLFQVGLEKALEEETTAIAAAEKKRAAATTQAEIDAADRQKGEIEQRRGRAEQLRDKLTSAQLTQEAEEEVFQRRRFLLHSQTSQQIIKIREEETQRILTAQRQIADAEVKIQVIRLQTFKRPVEAEQVSASGQIEQVQRRLAQELLNRRLFGEERVRLEKETEKEIIEIRFQSSERIKQFRLEEREADRSIFETRLKLAGEDEAAERARLAGTLDRIQTTARSEVVAAAQIQKAHLDSNEAIRQIVARRIDENIAAVNRAVQAEENLVLTKIRSSDSVLSTIRGESDARINAILRQDEAEKRRIIDTVKNAQDRALRLVQVERTTSAEIESVTVERGKRLKDAHRDLTTERIKLDLEWKRFNEDVYDNQVKREKEILGIRKEGEDKIKAINRQINALLAEGANVSTQLAGTAAEKALEKRDPAAAQALRESREEAARVQKNIEDAVKRADEIKRLKEELEKAKQGTSEKVDRAEKDEKRAKENEAVQERELIIQRELLARKESEQKQLEAELKEHRTVERTRWSGQATFEAAALGKYDSIIAALGARRPETPATPSPSTSTSTSTTTSPGVGAGTTGGTAGSGTTTTTGTGGGTQPSDGGVGGGTGGIGFGTSSTRPTISVTPGGAAERFDRDTSRLGGKHGAFDQFGAQEGARLTIDKLAEESAQMQKKSVDRFVEEEDRATRAVKQTTQSEKEAADGLRELTETYRKSTDAFSSEAGVIRGIAEQAGIQPQFLQALRRTEAGGPGREFGVLSVPAPTYQDQARVAAETVQRNIGRFAQVGQPATDPTSGRYTEEFIRFFSKRYAPIGAENDPQGLNRNHAENLLRFYNDSMTDQQVSIGKFVEEEDRATRAVKQTVQSEKEATEGLRLLNEAYHRSVEVSKAEVKARAEAGEVLRVNQKARPETIIGPTRSFTADTGLGPVGPGRPPGEHDLKISDLNLLGDESQKLQEGERVVRVLVDKLGREIGRFEGYLPKLGEATQKATTDIVKSTTQLVAPIERAGERFADALKDQAVTVGNTLNTGLTDALAGVGDTLSEQFTNRVTPVTDQFDQSLAMAGSTADGVLTPALASAAAAIELFIAELSQFQAPEQKPQEQEQKISPQEEARLEVQTTEDKLRVVLEANEREASKIEKSSLPGGFGPVRSITLTDPGAVLGGGGGISKKQGEEIIDELKSIDEGQKQDLASRGIVDVSDAEAAGIEAAIGARARGTTSAEKFAEAVAEGPFSAASAARKLYNQTYHVIGGMAAFNKQLDAANDRLFKLGSQGASGEETGGAPSPPPSAPPAPPGGGEDGGGGGGGGGEGMQHGLTEGVVPGPSGRARRITAHGGEVVATPDQAKRLEKVLTRTERTIELISQPSSVPTSPVVLDQAGVAANQAARRPVMLSADRQAFLEQQKEQVSIAKRLEILAMRTPALAGGTFNTPAGPMSGLPPALFQTTGINAAYESIPGIAGNFLVPRRPGNISASGAVLQGLNKANLYKTGASFAELAQLAGEVSQAGKDERAKGFNPGLLVQQALDKHEEFLERAFQKSATTSSSSSGGSSGSTGGVGVTATGANPGRAPAVPRAPQEPSVPAPVSQNQVVSQVMQAIGAMSAGATTAVGQGGAKSGPPGGMTDPLQGGVTVHANTTVNMSGFIGKDAIREIDRGMSDAAKRNASVLANTLQARASK